MADYILSCCSTADLTNEYFQSRGINYICFHYIMDGVEYPDDLGQSIPFPEFYRRMTQGADTSTSQVGVGEYVDYFSSFMEQGLDVLHVSLSTGLSGTF
ncbi:MAG: DegV family protein, partial [Firmicutes bacterium]|nr:DegV family protein [Bacillota bacterium]